MNKLKYNQKNLFPQKIGNMSIFFTSFVLLSGISCSANAALNAVTVETIQGQAPYIQFNGIKANDLSSLLSIRVGEDTYVSDAEGNMKKVGLDGKLDSVEIISLPNETDTLSSVVTIATPDGNPQSLDNTSIIPIDARIDENGDTNFKLTGNFIGTWKDSYGQPVTNLTGEVSLCKSPYSLTLSTTGSASIATQYGDPQRTDYGNSSAKFLIKPQSKPILCFIQPHLNFSYSGYDPLVWDPLAGFILQSTTNPELNFPTTGFNGATFYLIIGGVDATSVTWETESNPSSEKGVTAQAIAETPTKVKVTISGPNATNAIRDGNNQGGLDFSPTHIKITNTGTNNLSYEFKIKNWFVPRLGSIPDGGFGYVTAESFCKRLGTVTVDEDGFVNSPYKYTIPTISDYTNNTLLSSGTYIRAIGQGVFSEWGEMHLGTSQFYPGSLWARANYWASDIDGDDGYRVSSANGGVTRGKLAVSGDFAACIAVNP